MVISEALLIFVLGELIGLAIIIWKFASAYGQLKKADEINKRDINNIANKVRNFDRIAWQRLNNIENFLAEKHHYIPPSLNLFEENSQKD